ncbi:uncharacterized protein [Typha latifolia]|uniref:uncharacterized protein n=1 Tax=Typha latifolia TaxID=4733 RepID=UPI003C30888A
MPLLCRDHLSLLLLLLLVFLITSPTSSKQAQEDPLPIDPIVRDYAMQAYHAKHRKTAVAYNLTLPPTLSGVIAETVRYRGGSLRRHGVVIKEFSVPPGVVAHPHAKRLLIVYQNLGNLSSAYFSYRNVTGFKLVSPVLALLFYSSSPSLQILVSKKPITVNFSASVREVEKPLCMLFDFDGNVSLTNQTQGNVCVTRRQGHIALVLQGNYEEKEKISRWKIVLVEVVGGAFGAVLLGLMLVAMVGVKRRRTRMAAMERKAYEEEALQVSMVGHLRAPVAAAARTSPALEDEYAL